jgi:hypothetical protein
VSRPWLFTSGTYLLVLQLSGIQYVFPPVEPARITSLSSLQSSSSSTLPSSNRSLFGPLPSAPQDRAASSSSRLSGAQPSSSSSISSSELLAKLHQENGVLQALVHRQAIAMKTMEVLRRSFITPAASYLPLTIV